MSSCVMSICVMSSCMLTRHHYQLSHLRMGQLPRTQFTQSKAPNPHARKTSTQMFRISAWDSYPEHNLRTARRQTRMPARRRPHKIFAYPHGTAIPNTIYTQQGAKPACQEYVNTNFSYIRMGQLPRAQFVHSKAPKHQHKIFASSHGMGQVPENAKA